MSTRLTLLAIQRSVARLTADGMLNQCERIVVKKSSCYIAASDSITETVTFVFMQRHVNLVGPGPGQGCLSVCRLSWSGSRGVN